MNSAATDFFAIAGWLGWAALALAVLTVLAFIFGWGFRFRLVGVTAFTVVLIGGCIGFALGFKQPVSIEGAVAFNVVYDAGGSEAVVAVEPTIAPEAIEPTLKQAAFNLFSRGRYSSQGEQQLHVRLRTIVHPQPGISEPLYLGEVRRSLNQLDDEAMQISTNPKAIARLTAAEHG